jgi:hypothetical protein
MALNDIKVPKENAGGAFDEIALAASDLKLGTTANLPLKTGTNGVVEAGSFGTAAGSFCEGNDARLSDARTPSSTLAHKASHATGGTDALAPSDIGAQSIFLTEDLGTVTANVTLTAARAKIYTVNTTTSGLRILLPTTDVLAGDVVTIRFTSVTGQSLTPVRGSTSGFFTNDILTGQQVTFIAASTSSTSWTETLVDRHPATSSLVFSSDNTFPVRISGRTQEASVTSAGRDLLDDADAAAQRVTMGAAASGSITTSGLTQSTARILGRTTASTGAVEEITIGSGLSLSAGELSSTVSAGIPATLLDAKGDLIVASAADTAARLAVGGTNGHVLTVDSAETLGVKWAAAAGGVGGGTGSTDNSILRSDGTGGSTVQDSALVIDDAVVTFTGVTGDAGTDILTVTGHNFVNNQAVLFSGVVGGNAVNWALLRFVRDVSGSTFKVAATSGGAALDFTSNITAGSVVAIQNNVTLRNNSAETNSALVLVKKGNGAFIVSPEKPDAGATTGGTARGANAICIQSDRSDAGHVASGLQAIAIGTRNTASGQDCVAIGRNITNSTQNSVAIGNGAVANSGNNAVAIGSANTSAQAEKAIAIGENANLRAQFSVPPFRSVFWGGQTTNATPLILNLDATATNRFTIAASTALAVDILLVARRSDTQDKWLVARRFLGIRRDGSNNTSLIGSVQTLGTDQSDGSPSWTFALTADDTNEALQLEVTGAASETIQWRATAFYRVA